MANVTPRPYRTSELKSRITNLAQTSVYQIKIQPPPGVFQFLKEFGREFDYIREGENLEILCESAVLPGSAAATHDVTNDYAGVSEKMVYRRMYDGNMDLTFLVDHDYNVIEFFDGWIDYTTGVGLNGSRNMYKSRYANYRMSYPNDYRSEMYLTKFEKDVAYPGSSSSTNVEPKQLQYTLVGAFPESITSMPVSYGASDLLRCTVSMSYIRYVRERKKVLVQPNVSSNFNAFSSVFDFFS
tara:strand:+ start:45 stop:767 length:723 start_codon:yes stop_codon:yes gene_type:complete